MDVVLEAIENTNVLIDTWWNVNAVLPVSNTLSLSF